MSYRQPFRGTYPITQEYGATLTSNFHTGIDYAVPLGTPILASQKGIVKFAGSDQTGYGDMVIINHAWNIGTCYAHLSRIDVAVDDEVEQGQVIGLSGSSGRSTGPHLHFEARTQWAKWQTHFNPVDLPLATFFDDPDKMNASDLPPVIPEVHSVSPGLCMVVCDACNVRWADTMAPVGRCLTAGTEVFCFDRTLFYNGLPYRYIGANQCVAEYDNYGTQILDNVVE